MKVYAIYYGFYSSIGEETLDSLWSTEEKALNELDINVSVKNLIKRKDTYTDGDYYTYVCELYVDTRYMNGGPDNV